jgi:A/G-specific adenine glycosylase
VLFRSFPKFIKKFPSARALARATQKEVLSAWQGLGYNRRALYLRRTAQEITQHYRGIIPRDPKILEKLPGIGKNTAASISVFTFSVPAVFIETNIRSVFLFHFFKNKSNVSDTEIVSLIKKTLPQKNVREWYWALMDYGTHIKRVYGNQNTRSKHYTKQTKFEGSNRQTRARIIVELLEQDKQTLTELSKRIKKNSSEIEKICAQLAREKFIQYHKKGKIYSLVV